MSPKKLRKAKRAWREDKFTNGSAGKPQRLTLKQRSFNLAMGK